MTMAARLSPLIIGHHTLPQRSVLTDNGNLVVPRYISRCRDGWRVDFQRQCEPRYRCIFNDRDHGDSRGSLARAMEDLYDQLPNRKSFDQLHPGHSRWYQVREYLPRNRRTSSTYVQTYVCAYQHKLRTVNIYCGTENTVTPSKIQRAIAQAIGIRCWSQDTISHEGRPSLFTMKIPDRVERYAY